MGGFIMVYILPVAILAILILLLVAMLWRRPDPRHEFALAMHQRLAHNDDAEPCRHDEVAVIASPLNLRDTELISSLPQPR
jgi:hypothetical protein